MEQPEHPQPQEEFPLSLFRSFTMCTMIAATITTRTAQMRMVARFSMSHASILLPPSCSFVSYFVTATFAVSFSASLYGRNSIYTMNAMIATATMTPITLALPAKSMPS